MPSNRSADNQSDLVGQKFGKLTIVQYLAEKARKPFGNVNAIVEITSKQKTVLY